MTDRKLGPYRLGKMIGSGGMGSVFSAVNEESGYKAAIKVLPAGMSQNEGLRERFEREIDTLLQLRHPNIVRLFGFGEEEGELFYAMELVDGQPLSDIINKTGAMPWRQAVRYAREIAGGLRLAHDMGIVHRDIKPANILITQSDKVKILDFGIAKLFGATSVTIAGGIVGTADYMAPEQAFGEGVTPRADLYSLGAVLYAMLSRQPPFRGTSVTEILDKLRYQEPVPIDRLVETLPTELASLVTQLLEKDPNLRVPTATALCRRLDALLELEEDTDFDLHLAHDKTLTPEQSDDYQLKDREAIANQPTLSPTQVPSGLSSGDAVTEALDTVVSPRAVKKEEPKTRFTTVAEQRQRKAEESSRETRQQKWFHYVQIAGLIAALAAVVAIIVIAPRKPDADTLYSRIEQGAEDGRLGGVDREIEDFLTRFPEDERIDYVAQLNEELELRRQENRYRLTAALSSTNRKLHPVEVIYIESMKLAEYHPQQAADRLQALLMTFGPPESQAEEVERCLKLAERRLTQINSMLSENAMREATLIRERMDLAARIATEKPEEARKIYAGVVRLLEDRSWGANLATEANQALADL